MRRRRRTRSRRQENVKISWWIIAILIANLIFHAIPQEWIIGPVPSAENNYNQAESAVREIGQERIRLTEELTEPAAEILLDESQWSGMNDRKKVRVLERFAGEQAAKLGLRKSISVEVVDLDDPLAGQYSNGEETIYIDTVCFASYRPEKLAYIVCHEVRHAYQFALADAWKNLCEDSAYEDLELFQVMEDCYNGLNNYCHASEDREAYENQWVEEDAREYADREITRILMGENE